MGDSNKAPNGTFDPGWNDPPNLSYNIQHNNKPRNFLNKRVPFPMSSNAVSKPPAVPMNLPPMPTIPFNKTSLCTSAITSGDENINVKCPKQNSADVQEVKAILLELLENFSELRSKSNDIVRRISLMEEMWISGKLNEKIQLEMMNLAYALRDDMPCKADEIHKALMVDHISCVGSWMPGVKQLIHHSVARFDLLSIDKE